MSQCMFRGCREVATHAIKIVVPDTKTDRTSCEAMMTGLELCLTHASKAKAKDFFAVSPGLLESTVAAGAWPGTTPHFEAADIEAVALGTMEHKAHLGAAAGKLN
jgi:hypothetical protein